MFQLRAGPHGAARNEDHGHGNGGLQTGMLSSCITWFRRVSQRAKRPRDDVWRFVAPVAAPYGSGLVERADHSCAVALGDVL